jgi:hypothetical protein
LEVGVVGANRNGLCCVVLKLDGIGAGFGSSVNYFKRSGLAASMICGQFGDEKHRLTQ